MSFFESVLDGILRTTMWEWLAVFTGVAYVILAALRKNACWYFAVISAGIYVYLCVDSKLYIESALQLFYVGMAIMGWFSWRNEARFDQELLKSPDQESDNEIKTWSLTSHLLNLLISGGVALAMGYSFDTFTDQANPYADAFTTVFSLAATFMVVRKVLENWIYWIIIDLVSIFLYHERGYSLSAVLYFVFTIIAIAGFMAWYKKFKRQTA